MTNIQTSMSSTLEKLYVGIAWCLAWGEGREPQFDLAVLQEMRNALNNGQNGPEKTRAIAQQVQRLQAIPADWFPDTLEELREKYSDLWKQSTKIGLIYGGATKIKGYVFEAANLQDIRGASALLDQINLVDLPGFFGKEPSAKLSGWLTRNFPGLSEALIPELIIYSTGGNILAFCPAAFVDELSNAIEKLYTEETLTANSCAVGDTFRLLEIRFGLLEDPIEDTLWLDWYRKEYKHPLVEAYFGSPKTESEIQEAFENRKSFNELVGKLAAQFNQRRNGNDFPDRDRPSRRYPPMFETHPYLVRDESDRRSAVAKVRLPGEPWFSDTLARKRLIGQISKREFPPGNLPAWKREAKLDWEPGKVESWILKFDRFLNDPNNQSAYYQNVERKKVEEAQRTSEIGNASDGFVGFIYADGNNMGGYIQKIKTPEEYKQFSCDVDCATRESVYKALKKHLKPHRLEGLTEPDAQHRNGTWIHPFEILAIGGDDVLLIVPANKALEIAKTIGEKFESYLVETKRYNLKKNYPNQEAAHRYQKETPPASQCQLSMSIGVLITSYNTPIYYAKNLYEQLLKSAKKRAKELKNKHHYYGGTVDFLVMKAVTMISSNIEAFRQEGLTKEKPGSAKLKLYAAPYTLHELGGLLKTIAELKKSEFPRSQLYQIRSLLERGKHTAILNYLYFRVRLKSDKSERLKKDFDEVWCQAKTNGGNIAPWMYDTENKIYETIWREMVELYPFVEKPVEKAIPAEAEA